MKIELYIIQTKSHQGKSKMSKVINFKDFFYKTESDTNIVIIDGSNKNHGTKALSIQLSNDSICIECENGAGQTKMLPKIVKTGSLIDGMACVPEAIIIEENVNAITFYIIELKSKSIDEQETHNKFVNAIECINYILKLLQLHDKNNKIMNKTINYYGITASSSPIVQKNVYDSQIGCRKINTHFDETKTYNLKQLIA